MSQSKRGLRGSWVHVGALPSFSGDLLPGALSSAKIQSGDPLFCFPWSDALTWGPSPNSLDYYYASQHLGLLKSLQRDKESSII